MRPKKYITLTTYAKQGFRGGDQESKQIRVEISWLENYLKTAYDEPITIDEFLGSYTWDESEFMYNEYLKQTGREK